MIKQEPHLVKGMQKDTSVSKFNPEFVFDAQNIRITARDNNTLLSVTNEKGNEEVPLREDDGSPTYILGTTIGYCVLNNFLVLFTTSDYGDIIYRLEYKNTYFETIVLYKGNLGFSTDYPIETLASYENEDIQKVYWTDGYNPIRVINIIFKEYDTINKWNDNSFNIVADIELNDHITIERNPNGGIFSQGVIQYAFSYYNLYGKESNIFYTSPLYYLSFTNRGASPEEAVSCSFTIKLSNLDTNFDYVRVFSIFRSSINATSVVTRVVDLPISSNDIQFTDTGDIGDTVDSSELLYIGGEELVVGTMCSKDNTLFLGNIKLNRPLIDEDVRKYFKGGNISFLNHTRELPIGSPIGFYPYKNQLDCASNEIKTFKYLEWYRFGLQFQHRTGKWSEPVYINDCKVNVPILVGNNSFIPVSALYTLKASIIEKLKGEYKRVRPVVVYPSINKRSCIAQGVVCPTVYNVQDRYDNSPYCQSSWFFRVSGFRGEGNEFAAIHGAPATALHDYPIGGNGDIRDEVQCIWNPPRPFLGYRHPDALSVLSGDTKYIVESTKADEWVKKNCNNFYVDSSIFTLHSPDIEFDDSIQNINSEDLKFRIIGYSKLTSFQSKKNVQASTPIESNPSEVFYFRGSLGFNDVYIDQENLSTYGGNLRLSNTVWFDFVTKGVYPKYKSEFVVYPWQRIGSLNNSPNSDNQPSKLLYNRTYNLRYSFYTKYIDNIWTPSAHHCNIVTDKICKIDTNYKSIIYYGNIDRVVPLPYEKKLTEDDNVSLPSQFTYPIMVGTSTSNSVSAYRTTFVPLSVGSGITEDDYTFSDNPVPITYKSSPHAVIALDVINDVQYILPSSQGSNQSEMLSQRLFYNNDIREVHQDVIEGVEEDYDFLWVGELYREVNNGSEVFGDIDSNDNWLPAGEPISLLGSSGDINIYFTEGDTYFQRYDHVKTMPNTFEDTNQVTEVCSFMCETRVNIDGRYDKNRGVQSFTINDSNYNLINKVYSQPNNYFNYRIPNYNLDTLNYFPNTITWTKEKYSGSEIDAWTNITMASTRDLDGDKGEIVSLNTFNNEIFCFQKQGFSNILFNSRVQIPTSDGVPIEISNGLKVDGKRYISNTIGCSNKWSIVETSSGLYFIDNITNSIYLFNGQMNSLSDKLGFRQWIGENNSLEKWDPVGFKNFVTYYDKNNGDVYFVNNETALVYSELLGQFTSFMSYGQVPAMFNINSRFYAIQDGKVWEQFAGEYNKFFGIHHPYSITFISNADEPYDKIFNNIEFRADCWTKDDSGNEILASNNTFDTLEVWNEYQRGESSLTFLPARPSTLKKKFRVWRANVPRANTDWNGVKANNRDRIRNTWAYVKLAMNNKNNFDRMEFHDMTMHYFV